MTIDLTFFGYGAGLVMVGWVAGMMCKWAMIVLLRGASSIH